MSKLMNGGAPVPIKHAANKIHLVGLDYTKLKLFQLSILWRAGVSKLPPFSQVNLGPHEEKLRVMLQNGDPGRAEDYGCIMCILMDGKKLLTDLVVPPTWARLAGLKAYRFVFGGLVFVFVVSKQSPPLFVVENFAQPDGTVTLKLQEFSEMQYLVDTVSQLHSLGKLARRQ
ncbi:MAG: hypothetical protein K2X06_15750 [Burkholderiales bacterium]|nr:hypothetical protein [Burkholderiales bacterium]